MDKNYHIRATLRNTRASVAGKALLVAAALMLLAPWGLAKADTTVPPTVSLTDPAPNMKGKLNAQYGLNLFLQYLEKQSTIVAPTLAYAAKNPVAWTLRGVRATEEELGLPATDLPDEHFIEHLLPATGSLMRPPSAEETRALWFSSDYRHKGFLPTHDSVLLGINMRASGFADRAQLDVNPFYGQSWMGAGGYWGAEASLTLRSATGQSWAHVHVRYDNGQRSLMDHGRGYDMNGEVPLAEHLSLTAGIKQTDSDPVSDYVMMRYQIKLGEGL